MKFMTFDFEAVNKNDGWCAVALMIAEYPSGKILDFFETGCNRQIVEFDPAIKLFWEKNRLAFDLITFCNRNKIIEEEEFSLCEKIQFFIRKYPDIFIISDNPQFDGRFIDNILQKYNFQPISMRTNELYFQTLCTWSFKMAIKTILNLTSKELKLKMNQQIYNRDVDGNFGPRHTPKADCARILSEHFKILDVSKNFFFN